MIAVSKYKSFHGKDPKRVSALDFHLPRELVLLGRAVAIEYECDKRNGGGDGKRAVYRHKFDTPVILCIDETSKKQLYIIGRKLKVTSAGIEN